jgi:transcriptional regulator with XRE-family HTH domain
MERILLMMRNDHEIKLLKQFAIRLRSKRLELGLSQMQLAEMVDCHLNAISRIESGRTDPSLLMFLRICRALNLRPDELIPELGD